MNLLQIMMRNMRQFMSGMKNYLVKHGEREFEKEVEKERLKVRFQSITLYNSKCYTLFSKVPFCLVLIYKKKVFFLVSKML